MKRSSEFEEIMARRRRLSDADTFEHQAAPSDADVSYKMVQQQGVPSERQLPAVFSEMQQRYEARPSTDTRFSDLPTIQPIASDLGNEAESKTRRSVAAMAMAFEAELEKPASHPPASIHWAAVRQQCASDTGHGSELMPRRSVAALVGELGSKLDKTVGTRQGDFANHAVEDLGMFSAERAEVPVAMKDANSPVEWLVECKAAALSAEATAPHEDASAHDAPMEESDTSDESGTPVAVPRADEGSEENLKKRRFEDFSQGCDVQPALVHTTLPVAADAPQESLVKKVFSCCGRRAPVVCRQA